jgi:Sensors of blue-light using FAD
MITQLVYVSKASSEFLNSKCPLDIELNAISSKARSLNSTIGVTGLLLYKSGHFLQVLEGKSVVLAKLFEKIGRDPRHCNVERLTTMDSNHRMFENWNMGLVNLEEASDLDRSVFDEALRKIRYTGDRDDQTTRDGILNLLRIFMNNECAVSST